jgi:hypothetical protein
MTWLALHSTVFIVPMPRLFLTVVSLVLLNVLLWGILASEVEA